jgi:hypothetical protein
MATSFLPETLFYVHANLIADQMDEDIACVIAGNAAANGSTGIKSELREEMRRSWELNPNYRSLGFDPDYLMYTSEKSGSGGRNSSRAKMRSGFASTGIMPSELS